MIHKFVCKDIDNLSIMLDPRGIFLFWANKILEYLGFAWNLCLLRKNPGWGFAGIIGITEHSPQCTKQKGIPDQSI